MIGAIFMKFGRVPTTDRIFRGRATRGAMIASGRRAARREAAQMETTPRERSARQERTSAAQIRRAPWLLAAIVALALIVRVGLYAQEPRPYDNSGLAAEHGELARNIDDHGRW